jgi:hypothetical protein
MVASSQHLSVDMLIVDLLSVFKELIASIRTPNTQVSSTCYRLIDLYLIPYPLIPLSPYPLIPFARNASLTFGAIFVP